MIQQVKELCSQLKFHPFPELPCLAHRKVQIDKFGATQDIASHVAERTHRVWVDDGSTRFPAPPSPIQGALQFRRCRDGVANRIAGKVSCEAPWRDLELCRITDDIPPVVV